MGGLRAGPQDVENAVFCVSPAALFADPAGSWSWSRRGRTVGAASVALSLPRWGEGAGDEISGPRGGWGRGSAPAPPSST